MHAVDPGQAGADPFRQADRVHNIVHAVDPGQAGADPARPTACTWKSPPKFSPAPHRKSIFRMAVLEGQNRAEHAKTREYRH